MKESRTPHWISEHIPKELVDSTLFQFNIELQTVVAFVCDGCKTRYTKRVPYCTYVGDDNIMCSSKHFTREHKKARINMVPDLDLDYDILELQMQDLPSQYAFYASIYSEARLKVALEERKLKAIRGALIYEIQKRAAAENVRLTDNQIKNTVEAEKGIEDADKRLQLAQMQCGKLYHIMEALKMKAELARSLAGFKRQEQERS